MITGYLPRMLSWNNLALKFELKRLIKDTQGESGEIKGEESEWILDFKVLNCVERWNIENSSQRIISVYSHDKRAPYIPLISLRYN